MTSITKVINARMRPKRGIRKAEDICVEGGGRRMGAFFGVSVAMGRRLTRNILVQTACSKSDNPICKLDNGENIQKGGQ